MQPVKIILVPTDFSPASKQALEYACNLADMLDASLHIIHVLEDPFTSGAFSGYAPPSENFLEELARRARAELESQLTGEDKAKYAALFVLRIGSPAREILEYVKEQGAIDLVVLATAGRAGVARLMMASVADKIVRGAPCPVLTLHPPDRATGATYRAA